MTETVLCSVDPRGVATVTLNRPELRNAFDDALIAALTDIFRKLDADPAVRAVVLRGAGKSFSAGADLNWMRRMASYGEAENIADARALAGMLQAFDLLSKPTIAGVHGHCFAGGMGLAACADIVIAADATLFCLSEVRLGLVPGAISPYVIRAIGPRAMRRYTLTAERFDAAEARHLGLVQTVVPEAELDAAIAAMLGVLVAGGPQAQAQSKRLIAGVAGRPIDAEVTEYTARAIAEARASAEARDGLAAFFEKREPGWRR